MATMTETRPGLTINKAVQQLYTLEQVARHKTANDLWIAIHGKVCDVSNYLEDHPGGEAILLSVAGTDATTYFDDAGHSDDAREALENFAVGDLPASEPAPPVKIVFSSKPLPPVLPIGVSKSVLQVFGGKENLIKGVAFISAAILVQQYWSRIPETVAIQSPNNAVSPFWKGVTITAAIATAIVSAVVWNFYKTLVMRKGFRRYPPVIGRPTRALRGPKPREVIADVLTPHTYQHFPLLEKRQLSHNTYRLIFGLPKPTDTLGLPLGQHVNIRADIDGATVTRSYTPTSSNKDLGTMSLTVKVYHGSKMGNYLRNLPLQTPVSIRGPVGGFKKYHRFLYTHLAMVAGGTGITPMYQFIQEICNDPLDDTKITLLYGNRTEDDILMQDSMDALAKQYPGSFKVYYFLETPPQQWRGEKGRITKEAMLNLLPPVKTGLKYLVCGPDAMVGAVTDNLKAIGCEMSQAGSKSSGQVFVF